MQTDVSQHSAILPSDSMAPATSTDARVPRTMPPVTSDTDGTDTEMPAIGRFDNPTGASPSDSKRLSDARSHNGPGLQPLEAVRPRVTGQHGECRYQAHEDRQTAGWMSECRRHGMLPHATEFSLDPDVYVPSALPTLDEWQRLWAIWDLVSRQMLPSDALMSKPIKLRNACIFYVGHIPAFLDVQLNKAIIKTDDAAAGAWTAPTEPGSFAAIFERGIDPDVDNPELCHAHSEIPNEWPPLESILAYQARVRARVRSIYQDQSCSDGDARRRRRRRRGRTVEERVGRTVARAIWVAFEHEAMHLETLLYMMLQSDATQPPPQAQMPDWEAMADDARKKRTANEWFRVPKQTIVRGMNDPESSVATGRHFGWDNEKPARHVQVDGFDITGRPITNQEYAEYMVSNNITAIPASWTTIPAAQESDLARNQSPSAAFIDSKAVRTVFGLVPLKYTADWPIFASYNELAACAAWMGGRIPTADEVLSAYSYADHLARQDDDTAQRKLAQTVPAVNGHLLNDGVEETPPPSASVRAESLFADLRGDVANVGFRHWHPIPVTGQGSRLAKRGEMGGVWEWTSSVLEAHDGFQPMDLYPQYTADFFDGKHNVVLGGSWATHPRIAGRKSFVNWYQRNYPYAWAGARLARD